MSAAIRYDMPLSDERFSGLIETSPFAAGAGREVYNVPSDEDVVVKKVKGEFLSNYLEWLIWTSIMSTELISLFGRCITISPTGRFLMMERLVNLDDWEFDRIPNVPNWMTDIKRSSIGRTADGQIKLRDYASAKLGETLASAPRRRVAL